MISQTLAASRTQGRAKVIFLGVLLVIAGALAARQLTSADDAGSFVRENFEQQVGAEVARAVRETASGSRNGRVGVLLLSPHDHGPYAERLATLTSKLQEAGRSVGKYDALTGATKLYGKRDYEEDYSPSIDAALENLEPDVLIVLTAGGFTHARVSSAMEEFIRSDGRLVFVGQVFQTDSPMLGLIRNGAAVAVARNTGPLAARSPRTRTLEASSPDEYVRNYYTTLTADNIAKLLKTSP